MLVDLRLNLEVRQVVHLPDFLSRRDAGPQLHVQLSQLAVDFRAHLQAAFPLADKGQVALHVGQVVLHLFHLDGAVDGVLQQTLVDETVLAAGQLVVLAGLHELFAADERLAVQAAVLAEGALAALQVLLQLQLLHLVVQLVLLHRHLRVAQQVLLLRQFGLGIQDLQVQVAVRQADQHVASPHLRPFLHDLLGHDAAFLGRHLHHGDGGHLPLDAHEVIEPGLPDFRDVQRPAVHLQHAAVRAEENPAYQGGQQRAARQPRHVLAPETFLGFQLYIHNLCPLNDFPERTAQ